MIRTQIYLDTIQQKQLKIEAKKEHNTMSGLIRKAIDDFLNARSKKISWDKDPLVKSVGNIKLDTKDASINHDKYLY